MSQSVSLLDKIKFELLDGLNPVQKEGVIHEDGPLLIVAGAGSGKTRVITHRIAWLARIRNVSAWNIAAVTFTNKAAAEMRERLMSLMGPVSAQVCVRTFHSLGLFILSRNIEALNLKSGFSVFDSSAQNTVLKGIIKEKKLEGETFTPRNVANLINKARDRLIGPDKYEQVHQDFHSVEIAGIYREYIKRIRGMNALDFSDLLFETVRLLVREPEIRSYYQKLWKYFMIDEYQDTNHVQYTLGKLLTSDEKNIMVVGDDDQSIYSWRGADISNILDFEKDYPNARVLKLEENYRSTANILKTAASIIKNNSQRREKTLFTGSDAGENIKLHQYTDETHESREIVSKIKELKKKGTNYKDIAIFYRTNAQSRSFETALRDAGLPYVIVGDIRFYERKEIRDILAYLSVVVNPVDEISMERIINVPARGIGAGGQEKLHQLAWQKKISFLEALNFADELSRFRSAAKAKKLCGLFHSWIELHQNTEKPSIIARRVLEESGYLNMLQKDTSPESPGRIENLFSLIASIEEYEKEIEQSSAIVDRFDNDNQKEDDLDTLKPNLTDYLQKISLYSTREGETSDDNPDSDDMVFLMTLHNAKGLEFKNVFLTGVEEGILPHFMSISEGSDEEERRLMYVGITRARNRLFISRAARRMIQGRYQDQLPSRFINEIDPSILEESSLTFSTHSFSSPDAGKSTSLYWKKKDSDDLILWSGGDRVNHTKYGNGSILTVEQTVGGQKLEIEFDQSNSKKVFLAKYTPLTKI